jgi:hypothetical protein
VITKLKVKGCARLHEAAIVPYERSGTQTGKRPYLGVRVEDLRQIDLVKVDRAACHHVAQLTPERLLRVRLSPAAEVLLRGDDWRALGLQLLVLRGLQ